MDAITALMDQFSRGNGLPGSSDHAVGAFSQDRSSMQRHMDDSIADVLRNGGLLACKGDVGRGGHLVVPARRVMHG